MHTLARLGTDTEVKLVLSQSGKYAYPACILRPHHQEPDEGVMHCKSELWHDMCFVGRVDIHLQDTFLIHLAGGC